MQELQAIEQAALSQAIDDFDHLRRGQAELRAVSGRVSPASDTLGRQLGAHSEQRPDAELLGSFEHDIELF